jgi:hypothetical protein
MASNTVPLFRVEISTASIPAVDSSDSLTLDFDEWPEPVPRQHYCFRVGSEEFDTILERIKGAGLPFRSSPHGADDFQVNTVLGGKLVYWSEPDGHAWEILTVSYARPAPTTPSSGDVQQPGTASSTRG